MVNQILGIESKLSKIVSCLKKSRLDATVKGKDIVCMIPPYRFDIFGPMDLVEEVALGYGIQNLEPTNQSDTWFVTPSQTIGQINPVSQNSKISRPNNDWIGSIMRH